MWASKELEAERKAICKVCPHRSKVLIVLGVKIKGIGSDQCGKCGCFLNVKRKLGASECPIKKW